jgi:hypothetical protein
MRRWAFHPSHAAAASSAAAAAAHPGAAAIVRHGSSTTETDAAAALTLPVRTGVAAEKLVAAWEALAESAPECPDFLKGVQRQLADAGQQLQLLQLLGGAPAALARRMGLLAESEERELQLILFGTGSSSSSGSSSDQLRQQQPADSSAHLALLFRTGGGAASSSAGASGDAIGSSSGGFAGQHDLLNIGLSMDSLRAAGMSIDAYAQMRADEASHLLRLMTKEREAAAEAGHAAVMAR